MKQIMIICIFFAFAFICQGQRLKSSKPIPLSKEIYKNTIHKGRGQKALGSLTILGGAALSTLGARLAIEGIKMTMNTDDYYEAGNTLWKGGSFLFLVGLGTIGGGSDMIKDGTENVREGKIYIRMNSRSLGLVLNF